MNKRGLLMVIMLIAAYGVFGKKVKEPVKVACVGNSITYGLTLENREKDGLPASTFKIKVEK